VILRRAQGKPRPIILGTQNLKLFYDPQIIGPIDEVLPITRPIK